MNRDLELVAELVGFVLLLAFIVIALYGAAPPCVPQVC